MKKVLLFIALFINIYAVAQEGTKQFMPNSTDRLWLEFNAFVSKDFGEYGASDKERIYIYLNTGETMHFGMKMYTDSNYAGDVITDPSYVRFRIQDPDTNVVFLEHDMVVSGNDGYIGSYDQAIHGPNGVKLNGTTVTEGYTALTYTALKSGNHWIEFDADEFNFGTWKKPRMSNRFALEFFDVTVTDADNNVITNPGDPNSSAGRLWSKGWGLTTTSFTIYPVKTEFFVFTADEFVNKVKYEIKPYSFSFVANSYGVDKTPGLNYIEKAQSQEGDLTSTSDISEYRIFLNDPDRTVWQNTKLPPPSVKVWIEDELIYDYEYNRDPQLVTIPLDIINLEKNNAACPYASITAFKVETNVSGFTTVLLDIDGGGYSTGGNDRVLYLDLKRGINYVLWDFKNDDGNVITDGNITASATFLGRGPAHFPIYDAETLSGIETSSIRPFNKLGPTMYWDDRRITDWGDAGSAMIETDTSQLVIDNHIPRVWTYDESKQYDNHNGNQNTLNSWFNAIDLGLSEINFKLSTSLTKCVNGEAPYVGDIYIESGVDLVHNFKLSEFEDKFFDPKNDDLDSIAILSLPLNGTLKLSGIDVNINDFITSSDIANLTYTPAPSGWSGVAKFVWKATNGTYWSLNQDTVFMIVNTDPTISEIEDTTICTNTSLVNLPFTVNDAETDPGNLNVVAYSHDPSVVPNSNIIIGGSGTDRTITVNPPANMSGYTIIYVKVDDGLTEVIEEFALYIGPSISFTGDTTVCDGTPLELSAVEFGADSYLWQFDGSTIRTSQDLVIDPFTIDSVGTYTLIVSKDGCAASQEINVSIAPMVTFTGDVLVCEGETISLSADETVADLYSWKKGLSEIATTKVLSIPNADSGDNGSDYTLEVTKEGCNNTSDPFTISVIAKPLTNLTLTGSTVNRGNDGTVTVVSSEPGVKYNAYISGTFVISVDGNGGDVDLIIPAAVLNVGNNTIDVRAENTNCEIDMDNNATIIVIVEFTIDPIGNASVNENSIYTSVTPNLSGDTPVGLVTYTLSGADATDFTINPATGVVSMLARDFENPVDANTDNIYELTITAIDEDGNNDSEDWTVTVDDITEVAIFNIDAISDATVIENNTYTSVTPGLSGDTPIGNVTYTLGGTDADDFTIDAGTGVVSMIAQDYESPEDDNLDNVYELTIIATDDDGNFDNESWKVTVQDEIELAVFTINAIADVNNNENSVYTSVTPSITGIAIGNLTYTISGSDASDFTINASTGVVSMIARNYENPEDANTDNVYELVITATDEDGNDDTEDWTVTIDDVFELANFTINAISDATVNENSAYISVTPVLSGDTPIGNITYTLGGTDAADFTINASTGVVSMVARNYESPADANTDNVYELNITVTDDDGNSDTEDWTVTIEDVVESVLFTIDAISNTSVNENTPYISVTPVLSGGTPIGNVIYTLSGNDASDFTINASTGVVSMIVRNYENPEDSNTDNIYELAITATDEDGNNDSEDWTVTVNDVVETVVFTIDAIADANVNENSVYTSVTPNLSGAEPIGNVIYTLGGTDVSDFTINASTGVVSMVARDYETPVDANTDNVYELTITATDEDGNFDVEDWTVTVNDVIETVSFTINAIGDANVNENVVYTSVTPGLSGSTPIGNVTYTLGGTDASDFTINASTGVVSMITRNFENPEDANTDNVYELSIIATDDDGNFDVESWMVTVIDVIELAAFTIDAIADANINENSVYTGVTPNLSGEAPIGNIIYTISGADAADFTINATSGVVSMVARDFESPVDANTDNVYELTITVTDEDGNNDSEDWTVTVNDIVEVAVFTIDAISDANVNENSAYTSVTPNLSGDAPIGNIIYTISGTDAADFTINAVSGVVSMVARDFESPVDNNTDNIYELTITAIDEDGNNDSEDWTVTVDDIFEAAVFTIDAISNTTVNENSAYTSVTPNLSGATPIGNITYTLGGTDGADFTINATTGVVQMIARNYESPVDNNSDNVYELTITATDDDGNADSEDCTVTVLDLVELSSFTIAEIADISNNENSTYTSVTPSITGTPIGNVTYTLGGADASDFTINASTGVVSMIARNYESPEDANTDNIYEVSITATDDDGNFDTESWTVTIDDVIESVSFTINAISDANVDENSAYTSVTPGLSGATPIGNVTYTLGGTDASDFTINASNGVVSMIVRNYESPEDANTDNIYELIITATDDDGNSDSEDWTVTVDDIFEAAVFTIDAISNTTLNENSAYTSVTPNLSGATPIGNITYTLGGTDGADFTINAITGVVQMIARNYESPVDNNSDNVYELTITATDDDGNADSEDWTVTVLDLVELSSFTIAEITDISNNENSIYTSVTPSITGTPIGNVTYTLGGADASEFTINASTGVVSMIARNYESPEDANTDNIYEVSIIATDDDGNFDTESWTVTIFDVIEPVSFTIDAIFDVNVDENSAYTSVTPSLSGAAPIGSITYTLGGADASDFTINASNGVVSMIARNYESPADANTDNIYELTITATDDDGNADSESWTVTVNDVIEVSVFSINPIANTSINENGAYVTVAPSITGTPIGVITYTLGGVDAASFTINPVTGVVSMIARNFENPDDANTDNTYELIINATDADGNFDSEDWTVTINDVIEIANITIDLISDATVDENDAYTSVTPSLSGDTPIGNIIYTISGTDAAAFTINATTGVVQMIARNFENPEDNDLNNIYELTITVTDDDGNSDSEDWTVSVQDIVETVTFSIDPIADEIIFENNAYISVLPTITGTPVGTVDYTLGGADAARFTVNISTGVVSMIARDFENPLDANTDNIYELTLIATDDDGNTDIENWTVTIQNIIEVANFTIDEISDETVVEGFSYTSVTPNLTGDTPTGDIAYTLSGADAADFTIDSNTGEVSMLARDYENPVDDNLDNIYEVTIIATDEEGNNDSESWTVTVKVDTDNDGIPDDIDTDDDNDGNPDTTDPNILVATAVNDIMNVIEGETETINILSNDDFLPGANTDIVDLGTGTAAGTIVINSLTGEFTYTPILAEVGSDVTLNYRAANVAVTPVVYADAVVTITVVAANNIPVAFNDSEITDEDTDINIDILSNDTGLGDGGIAISIIENPLHGIVNIEVDNTITYSPDADFYGSDSIEYEVCDIDNECSRAKIYLTVNPVSDFIPVAVDDSRGTSVNTAVIADVLMNDTGLGDGGLVLLVTSAPANGTYEINGDSTITYTPGTDFLGTDNFDYRVCDIDGDCASATVTIIVKESNNKPLAVDDEATTIMNTAVDIDVLNNDTGLEDGVKEVTINTNPTKGALIINSDNTITYTPNPDYIGSDSFEYMVKDNDEDYSFAQVSITVTSIPDYIPIANDDSQGTSINTATTVDVLDNDTGLEDGGLILTVISFPTNGTYTINGDNTITYTPGADYLGTDNFDYQVCDADGDCSSATVTITVKLNNHVPIAVDDEVTTIMNTAVDIDVLKNDTGLEDGVLSVTEYTAPLHGNIVVNDDNTITYTPNNWYVGSDSFEYKVNDTEGDNSVAQVTITISSIPDYIPVANDDSRGTSINTAVTVDVLDNDTGLEDGGLILTVISAPTNGTYAINGDNTITYTPGTDYLGTDNFDYQVCDADGDCSDARVTITVKEINNVPVAVDDDASTIMNESVDIDVLSNDTGLEDGVLNVTEYNAPLHGNIVVNDDNTITYIPNNWYVGSDSFEYKVIDIDGDNSVAKVIVTIDPKPNYIPVANDDSQGTSINTAVIVDVLDNDTGLEDGVFAVTFTSNPTNGTFVINADNTITYAPNNNYLGTDNFDYQVCDVDGECSIATVTITVREENTVPVAINDKVFTSVDTDVTIDVLGNDTGLDDEGIIVSVETDAVNGSLLKNTDNTITYSPNNGFEGTEYFSYRVIDIDGDYDIADVEVIVMSGTLPGVTISAISGNTDENGSIATFTVILNTQPTAEVNIDLNSNDLTEGAVSATGLTFTPTNWNTEQTITVTGQDDYIDDDDINYSIIIDNAISSDAIYNGLTINNITLLNIDDDVAGISVITGSTQTSEEGGSVSFKLVLNSEPVEDVTIELSSDDLSEGMLEIIEVLFTATNWDDTVSVVVTGQDDDEIDGDISYSITISPAVSMDSKYAGYDPTDILLVNIDNDSRDLTIPEAFSPGNDGFNDYFEIINLENYEKASLRIYNRWGSLVYSNDNYQNDWDGKSNIGSGLGSELPMGTYFYILEISGVSKKINGSVFIKR